MNLWYTVRSPWSSWEGGDVIVLSFKTNDIWFSFHNPYASFKDVDLSHDICEQGEGHREAFSNTEMIKTQNEAQFGEVVPWLTK